MIEMPAPRFVQTNGIRMAVYAAGEDAARPPIVLCHGWPEIAFSWRHQIKGLAERGFRVLAPDQRGYGLTDRPEPVEAYDIVQLTGDLVGLLDAEGIEKAVFVGHDWGGLVVWPLAVRHPERVAGVVGVNTPFFPRAPIDPIDLFRKVWGEDFYIVFFQQRDAPEAAFEADLDMTFRFMMRAGSISASEFEKLPATARSLPLQTMLKNFNDVSEASQILSPEERAVFVETFRKSGFRGGINWYRNFSRNWELSAGLVDHVSQPALMIMAENDVVLPPSAADGMERFVPNLTRHLVRGCGHWTQQEKPEEVTDVIASWMDATFR